MEPASRNNSPQETSFIQNHKLGIRIGSSLSVVAGCGVGIAAIAATVIFPVSLIITVPVGVLGLGLIGLGVAGWIATAVKTNRVAQPILNPDSQSVSKDTAQLRQTTVTHPGEVDSTGVYPELRLTPSQLEALRKYKADNIDTLSQYKKPTVLRNAIPGLGHTVLVVPDKNHPKVYVLMKSWKGEEKAWFNEKEEMYLGKGSFKKATLAIEVDTLEKKAFVSDQERDYPMSEEELQAVSKYKDVQHLVGGIPVEYTDKKTNEKKLAILLDIFEVQSDRHFFNKIYNSKTATDTSKQEALREIYKVAFDAAKGIRRLHRDGFVHRDIKPANIMIKYIDGIIHAAVIDFGTLAKPGRIRPRGTAHYLDPTIAIEMVTGSTTVTYTTAADVWAFGACLWDFKAGYPSQFTKDAKIDIDSRKFWPGSENGSVVTAQQSEAVLEEAKKDHLKNRNDPTHIDYIIDHCLHVDPNERWTMDQVVQHMEKHMSSQVAHS